MALVQGIDKRGPDTRIEIEYEKMLKKDIAKRGTKKR